MSCTLPANDIMETSLGPIPLLQQVSGPSANYTGNQELAHLLVKEVTFFKPCAAPYSGDAAAAAAGVPLAGVYLRSGYANDAGTVAALTQRRV